MLTLPDAILPVLHPFATLFRSPTWLKAQILLVGAILAPGQRTVAAALRVMGLSDDRNYARYHQVLNRAVWSPRQAAGILLVLLLQHLSRAHLRTLQRRVQQWRGIMAKKLVYATAGEPMAEPAAMPELALAGVDPKC